MMAQPIILTLNMKAATAKHWTISPRRRKRNFGHQLAITAGIRYESGDAVVVMGVAHLQDPPTVI